MENKKGIFWKSALNHGVIFGIVVVIIQVLMWMLNFVPIGFGKMLLTFVIRLALYVTILFLVTKHYRDKSLGGFIPYGQAFLYGLTVFMIASIIGAIYNFIFLSFIDPEYTTRVLQITSDWTENFMRSKGIPDAQISAALDKMHSKPIPSPLNSSLKSLIFSLIMGAIVSLISSAFAKKVEDPFQGSK